MHVFDASSIINAWDNYPIKQFPGLWDWLAEQIQDKELVLPKVAFGEVMDKAPECADWLKQNEITILNVTDKILQGSMLIKRLVGIVDDKYHPKGVDEKDIIIIATAKSMRKTLVSDEGRQARLPDIPQKMKIPAVCNMDELKVHCINFIEYLRDSEQVFR